MRAKHHMPVFLYDKAFDIVQNLWRVSLKRKFNSKHVLDKNQGPKIYSLEDREPWMNVTDQNWSISFMETSNPISTIENK